MNKFVCVHGHFYQPPRENPWLELIEMQDSARPFHDWNERVTFECYEPNTASRIMENSRIIEIVNNYKNISFNFGPTLLSWLEKYKPDVYNAIQQADRDSTEKNEGHGSAIAQAYNHMIMPLANARDKETQVIWGIRDFEFRFSRKPEGMWLPETAVDTESLEYLAKHGIKFTILAPGQADEFRKIGSGEWIKLIGQSIDPRTPYLYKLPSGRSIVLFFYDGPVSHDLAFNGLLENGKAFADRLMDVFDNKSANPQLVHVATDGESYGHHHKHGDMALAFCLHYIDQYKQADLINYARFLSWYEPQYEVLIHENTSWSCAHGIERWRSNCGCKATSDPKITQVWREPLRKALDWLRDEAASLFEEKMLQFTDDPWHLRNEYIYLILDRSEENLNHFLFNNLKHKIQAEDRILIIKLLEMQRHAMLMYTSCGWFFNDISGIETLQIIQYAARVIQLTEQIAKLNLEPRFLEILEQAKGNTKEFPDGRAIYEKEIKPKIIDLRRVAGHFAVLSLYTDQPDKTNIGAYQINRIETKEYEAGRHKIAGGILKVRSMITSEEKEYAFTTLNLGSYNILGGVCNAAELADFETAFNEVKAAHNNNNINDIIEVLNKHFGTHEYSFWHIFHDEQRSIINKILQERLGAIEGAYKLLFNTNYSLIQLMNNFKMPMPDAFSFTGEFILNAEIKSILQHEEIDLQDLQNHLMEIEKFSFNIDQQEIAAMIGKRLVKMMNHFAGRLENIEIIKKMVNLLSLAMQYKIDINFWKIQNMYYRIGRESYHEFLNKAAAENHLSEDWIGSFRELGSLLNIKLD